MSDNSNIINTLKSQIEYYMSDANLENDKFFNSLMSNSLNKFIDISVLLNCNKIKNITTDTNLIQEAISNSDFLELNEDKTKFSRKDKNIPKLQTLLNKKRDKIVDEDTSDKKDKEEIVIYTIKSNKCTEIKWKLILDAIMLHNPGLQIPYLRFSMDNGNLGIYSSQTSKLIKTNDINVEDIIISINKAEGDDLLNFWKCHGSHLEFCLKRCNRELKKDKNNKKLSNNNSSNNNNNNNNENSNNKDLKKSKEGKTILSKPIHLGNMKFIDIKDIRQKARTIMNNIKEGEKPQPHDNKFLEDIISYHPNKEKASGLDYFSTGQNPNFTGSKCFIIYKKDGTNEDFSINKCLEEISSKLISS